MTNLVPHRSNQMLQEHPVVTVDDPVAVYLGSVAEGTRSTIVSTVNHVAGILEMDPELIPWSEIRYAQATAIRAKLIESGNTPATVSKKIYHLKGILRHAMLLNLLPQLEYLKIAELKPVRGSRVPRGRALTAKELESLFASDVPYLNSESLTGARNLAILGLGYGAGLRESGIVSVRIADDMRTELRVIGKGNKERVVPISGGLRRVLDNWYEFRGRDAGPIVMGVNRWGQLSHKRLSRSGCSKALARALESIGIEDVTSHDLRRTFISSLLDAGVDIVTVQKLAGHSNVQTTASYDRRPAKKMHEAVVKIEVPGWR